MGFFSFLLQERCLTPEHGLDFSGVLLFWEQNDTGKKNQWF